MNNKEFIADLANRTKMSSKEVASLVGAAVSAITNELVEENAVFVPGFGTFEVKVSAEREGRNPKTGETIKIPASKKPSFSASKVLKDGVNA